MAHAVLVTVTEVMVWWVRVNIGVTPTVVNMRRLCLDAGMLGARSGSACSQCLWTEMAVSGIGSWQRRESECMGAMCGRNESGRGRILLQG